jgi:photosystem II stability/assembly factor-like uncharacterized protein
MNTFFRPVIILIVALAVAASCSSQMKPSVKEEAPGIVKRGNESGGWAQTGGPSGGYINKIVIDPEEPASLYAAGSPMGLYMSENGGESWTLLPFEERSGVGNVEIDPHDHTVLYCTFRNFSRSDDGGRTWREINRGFGDSGYVRSFLLHPEERGLVYAAVRLFDKPGSRLYRSTDSGDSWRDISASFDDREDGVIDLLAYSDGMLFTGVNYGHEEVRHGGKVFVSDDGGKRWKEVDFGQSEKRFIFSIFANPHKQGEVWISEGPLFNESISQPMLYRSTDNGASWKPVFFRNVPFDSTQVRVIGAGSDGRVYIAAGGNLSCTADGDSSFVDITPDRRRMEAVDYRHIAVNPGNPSELFLPLRATGIAHSTDGGRSWQLRHEGIIGTNINLLAADPADPAVVYAAATAGEGTFRSDDYGQSWTRLNAGGIIHSFGDEMAVDSRDPGTVWFISDVPIIHRSRDRGSTWEVLADVYKPGGFGFASVYAMAPSSNPDMMYALNNGFGIYKGFRESHGWQWRFLKLSEVDYSYTLTVPASDENLIYSGYSRKPFEAKAKIRVSRDGGESWTTALEIEGAEAVTSVVVDPNDVKRVYATSTGESGGAVWLSRDGGRSWTEPNPQFNFCTVHSFALAGEQTAYAGVWGGGTYRTIDGGRSWKLLPERRIFSAAAIVVDPSNPETIYVADRTRPVVYCSSDGGEQWKEYFDAGEGYARLMHVVVDPHDEDTIYVSAMRPGHAGRLGSLFEVRGGRARDITGNLEKVVLTVTPDPVDSDVLYTVLHESGVYRSEDGGSSWQDISGRVHGLPDSGFSRLYVDPSDAQTLYLVGGCDMRFETFESAGMDPDVVNGIYRSSDEGRSWRKLCRGALGRKSGEVKSLAISSDGGLYAAAENGAYYSVDNGASWKELRGLPYRTLGGLSLQETANGRERVYAFTNGAGLYTGSLRGKGAVHWDGERKLDTHVYFTQILKDPRPNDVLYASGFPGGIFKSDDGGVSWHEKNFGMVSFDVEDPLRQGYYALAISPGDPEVLYLGLYGKGVYRSANGASTWYPVNGASREMAGKLVTALVVDHRNSSSVYVATEDGIYKTGDGGRTWRPMSEGLPTFQIRTLCQNTEGELFAGSKGYGLFQWRDNSWQPLSPLGQWGVIWPIWDDRPLYQYTSILIHPEDSRRVMIGTFPQGIYLTEDGGRSWYESNVGWTMDGVFRLVHHPEYPELVFAGTYNGLNRSSDFGAHWQMADEGWPDEQWVFSIDFDPENHDIMYACSKNGENEGRGTRDFHGIVMKSTDGGDSWFSIMSGLDPGQEFYEILVDRFNSDVLYLAAESQGVMLSTDAGQSWQPWNEGLFNKRPGTNGNNVTRCMVLSADGNMLYFGSAGAGVFRRERYK